MLMHEWMEIMFGFHDVMTSCVLYINALECIEHHMWGSLHQFLGTGIRQQGLLMFFSNHFYRYLMEHNSVPAFRLLGVLAFHCHCLLAPARHFAVCLVWACSRNIKRRIIPFKCSGLAHLTENVGLHNLPSVLQIWRWRWLVVRI